MEVFKIFATFSLYDMISKPLNSIQLKMKATNTEATGLTKKMMHLGKSILPVAAAAGLFLAVLGSSVNAAAEFQTSMAKTSTMFKDVNVNISTLNKDILTLSMSSGIAAKELGLSLYNALSAGIPVTENMTEAIHFMEQSTRLAKAGFTDVDTAVTTTAKVLNAYKMDISKVDSIHKVLMQTQNNGITTVGELGGALAQVTPTAAAMGVSFEQVGAALASMTAQGTPTTQATTQLNSMLAELGKQGMTANKNLMLATRGTQYAGMSFQEMMQVGVPLNEVLGLMSNMADRNGKSMIDMFSSIEAGKSGLALSGANAKQFTDNLISMSTGADVVGIAYKKMAATLPESLNRMNAKFTALKITIGNLFIPVVTVLGDVIGDVASVLTEIAANPIGSFILKLAAGASALVIGIVALVGIFLLLKLALISVGVVLAGISAPVWIFIGLALLLVATLHYFKDEVIWIFNVVKKFIVGWFNFALSILTGYINYLLWWVDLFIGIFNKVINFFKTINLFDSGKKLLMTFVNGILSAINLPKKIITSALQGIRNLLPFSDAKEGPLSTLTLSGSRMMTTLATGVEEASPDLKLSTDKALENINIDKWAVNSKTINDKKSSSNKNSTNINISNITLPNVQDALSFIDELRRLKLSLGV